jgi:hypothetical protein
MVPLVFEKESHRRRCSPNLRRPVTLPGTNSPGKNTIGSELDPIGPELDPIVPGFDPIGPGIVTLKIKTY